jgi:outer membrane protein assembly factor BamB
MRIAAATAGFAVLAAGAFASGAMASDSAKPVPKPPEARTVAGNWPYPNHDLANSRLATGSPINAANVSTLTEAWRVPALAGLPTSPIIDGNYAFAQVETGAVVKVNITTGKVAWRTGPLGFSVGPNGVVVGWGKVFGTTGKALFALNETTGAMLWKTPLNHTPTEGVDVQPQLIGHTVVASSVPVAGLSLYKGGSGGWISAVAEQTGKVLWNFDTIASPTLWGHPTINSGGGTWYPPSYSPATGLLYFGVANPAPFVGVTGFPNGSSRPGRNLYTDSTVALNLATGKLAWYLQAHPHDLFDRDFVHTMVVNLARAPGKPVRTVVVGTGKGGVVIGMDQATGKQLWKTSVGVHLNDNLTKLTGKTTVLPGSYGGVLTPPASAHGRVFVAALNAPSTYYPDKTNYNGSDIGTMPGDVVAMDARTGKKLWDTKVQGDPTGGVTLVNDLVLTATVQGNIYALSMSTGKIVWTIKAPGGINGWMSIAGNTVIVPISVGLPPILWALRLPAKP